MDPRGWFSVRVGTGLTFAAAFDAELPMPGETRESSTSRRAREDLARVSLLPHSTASFPPPLRRPSLSRWTCSSQTPLADPLRAPAASACPVASCRPELTSLLQAVFTLSYKPSPDIEEEEEEGKFSVPRWEPRIDPHRPQTPISASSSTSKPGVSAASE